jgi:hypothetical protein
MKDLKAYINSNTVVLWETLTSHYHQ